MIQLVPYEMQDEERMDKLGLNQKVLFSPSDPYSRAAQLFISTLWIHMVKYGEEIKY